MYERWHNAYTDRRGNLGDLRIQTYRPSQCRRRNDRRHHRGHDLLAVPEHEVHRAQRSIPRTRARIPGQTRGRAASRTLASRDPAVSTTATIDAASVELGG